MESKAESWGGSPQCSSAGYFNAPPPPPPPGSQTKKKRKSNKVSPKRPKSLVLVRVERCVVTAVRVSSDVPQPDVVAGVGQQERKTLVR